MEGRGLSPLDAGKLSKISKNFIKKSSKMHYFSLFHTIFDKPCVFSHVWTKNTNCWESFEKMLKISDENSIEKLSFLNSFWKGLCQK